MTEPATTPESPKKRRWLWPVLAVSLTLNLLVASILVGWMVSPDGPRKRPPFDNHARGIVGEPFVRALPAEDRRALFRDILSDRERLAENREAFRQRFADFLGALRATPFDPDTVAALLEHKRQVGINRQKLGEALLLQRIEAMSDAERASYADALENSLRRLRQRSERR